jgi:hypothetical protein
MLQPPNPHDDARLGLPVAQAFEPAALDRRRAYVDHM